jgi:N-acyl-D-amino-acid deacylase
MFDITITGGTIYDGKGGSPFQGDVGIRGDRIAAVGESLSPGDKIIEASGKIVCPGFIDIHSHSDFSAVINPNLESKIRQGVTTELVGNCGFSATPILDAQHRADLSRKYDDSGIEITWSWPEEYFATLEQNGISLNIAALAGLGNIRTSVMGRSAAEPSPDQMRAMSKIARRCLREGVFGISTGLIYPPGTFSTAEEIVELLSPVRECRRLYTTHMRNEGDHLVQAVHEAVNCARQAGVRLQISHLKAAGKANWGRIDGAFEVIESARQDGLDVTCDRYPYTAASTSLDSILPKWAYEGGDDSEMARLADAGARAKMAREIREADPDHDLWSRVIVSYAWAEDLKSCEGKSLAEIAEERKGDCCEVLFDILLKDQLRTEMVSMSMCEENLERVLRKPYVMIGSDAAAKADYGALSVGKPHPRAYGTFPRVLSRYVRDGMLEMSEAIAKMTSMPAQKIGLTHRGTFTQDAYADLVVFDPERITDAATYSDPHRYSDGIDLVIVNGKVAMERGKFSGVLNGRVLRPEG